MGNHNFATFLPRTFPDPAPRTPHHGRIVISMTKRLVLIGSLAIAGVLSFGHGDLLAKAERAQLLLERAWARTIHGERDVKPW